MVAVVLHQSDRGSSKSSEESQEDGHEQWSRSGHWESVQRDDEKRMRSEAEDERQWRSRPVTAEDTSQHRNNRLEGSMDQHPAYRGEAVPASSSDFAELFPSTRLLSIKHDDTTVDGNMNLRVDTTVDPLEGGKRDITLFHLRLYDLKGRSFSLRRYCRDSGREICHSDRKTTKHPLLRRPTLPRSLSNAFAGIVSKSDSGVRASSPKALNRIDSGYDSLDDEELDENVEVSTSPSKSAGLTDQDVISLEFSNYAHVDVRRKGVKNAKRYTFEYWGIQYSWRRIVRQLDDFKEVSYHLVDNNDGANILAHIVPVSLNRLEARDEVDKGGWIPPCSMWLSDEKLFHGHGDVSDIIVSTGLVVLVDDCIRRRFQSKEKQQLIMSAPSNLNSTGQVHYTGRRSIISETKKELLNPPVSG